ncbi:hypothetical protein DRO48_02865 [Candidatus Bathyarchaeota archaeon]|nr:MAG: hypothetical protein DRO48_02865 [Candidatus Bathyarchaeota archaeon]
MKTAIIAQAIEIPGVIVSLIAIVLMLLVVFEVFNLIEHRREAYERAQERKEMLDFYKARAIADMERQLKKYLRMAEERKQPK